MRILVSNDDGIYSPGLAALARIAARFGDVLVVAPDVEQSATGHGVTQSRPMTYKATPHIARDVPLIGAFRVDGKPADCVAIGLHRWGNVDVVLSGINLGTNLGNSIWHSGTVAAAKQASLLGVQGIAISSAIEEDDPAAFDSLTDCLVSIIECLLEEPRFELVNVNLPAGTPKGIRWTHQSVRHYDGKIFPQKDPNGYERYWFMAAPRHPPDEGSDRWAVKQGYASVTPLRLDLTAKKSLEEMKRLKTFRGFENSDH